VSFDVAYAEVPRALRQRPSILLASSEIELGGGPTGPKFLFGSKADMCVATRVSALPPKADMCVALARVRFGPIALEPLGLAFCTFFNRTDTRSTN
jgi:hypothetical protein